MRASVRVAATATVALVVLAGCIPTGPSPILTPSPPSTVPPPGPTSDASTTPSSSASAEPSPAVAVDPALLELLPDSIGGVRLQPDAATAAEIAREPSIAPFVESLAIAAAFGPLASGSIGDYVVVTVARPKAGLLGALFFRTWRQTYDDAVCQQAGGVQGDVEATIGGRQTFIGTCAGGIHTYHVLLPGQNVIVSMQGGGPGRFGEHVVEGLNE